LAPPSFEFPLGTDELGRSYLPRLVQGISATFLLATTAVMVTAIIGGITGMLSAYRGGFLDGLVVRIADVFFAFPIVLTGLLVTAIVGPGTLSVLAVIASATLPMFIRLVRSVTLGIAARGFVTAAEVAGASTVRVLFIHLLPNIIGATIIQLTYAISIGMLIEGVLSFLGIGVQPPEASLGSLLRQGVLYLTVAPWMVFSSGFLLTLAILSINLLGDGLRDAIDPLRDRALR
jgi:peptide/nickel transport system permease protein